MKKQIKFNPRETPGVICIERQTYGDSILITGTLIVIGSAEELNSWLEEEIEAAVREIKNLGGTIRIIKAALTVSTTSVITLSDEEVQAKEAPNTNAQIVISAAIMELHPSKAELIIRKALAAIRTKMREKMRENK